MHTTALVGSLLLFTVAAPVVAQEGARRKQADMGSGARMIIPIDAAKVFRNIRPVDVALQVKLAEVGLFNGRIKLEPNAGTLSPADTVRIAVTLREFAIEPDTIRILAARPVTLVIHNAGLIPHEFMAGRDVHDGDFEHDLFAGVHVNMVTGGMAAEGGGHEHPSVEHGGAGEHGERSEDGHGTMITADADQTVYMFFTLPESRRGVWSTACFLPGHYEAGMRGTLIVQ